MHFVNIYDMPGSPDVVLVGKEINNKINAKLRIHSSVSHPHVVPNLYDFMISNKPHWLCPVTADV